MIEKSAHYPLIILFSFLNCILLAQDGSTSTFDTTLARQLGADEYGMRMYALVMLTSGNADLSKEVRDSLFNGHMANIHRLADEGKLSLAGPFSRNDRYRGLFIFNVTTPEEAEALVRTDPAVAGGVLGYEIFMWYGSAAVQQLPALHDRIQEKKP